MNSWIPSYIHTFVLHCDIVIEIQVSVAGEPSTFFLSMQKVAQENYLPSEIFTAGILICYASSILFKMNPNILARKFECVECHRVPDDPHVAEDGCLYHERCIKEVFESFGNDEVLSPVTGEVMGRTVVRATNIRSLVKRIKDSDGFEGHLTHYTGTDEAQTNQIDDTKSVRGYLISEDGFKENFSRAFVKCQTILDSDRHNGHATALLGLCYIHGHGISVDTERGIELLVHGTQLGCGGFLLHVVLFLMSNPLSRFHSSTHSAYSSYKLGSFYHFGFHARKDSEKAQILLRQCQAQENLDGSLNAFEIANVTRYLNSYAETEVDPSLPSSTLWTGSSSRSDRHNHDVESCDLTLSTTNTEVSVIEILKLSSVGCGLTALEIQRRFQATDRPTKREINRILYGLEASSKVTRQEPSDSSSSKKPIWHLTSYTI